MATVLQVPTPASVIIEKYDDIQPGQYILVFDTPITQGNDSIPVVKHVMIITKVFSESAIASLGSSSSVNSSLASRVEEAGFIVTSTRIAVGDIVEQWIPLASSS